MVEKLPSMCGAHHVLSTDWVTQLMSCLSLLAVLLVFFVIAGACGMLVHADVVAIVVIYVRRFLVSSLRWEVAAGAVLANFFR